MALHTETLHPPTTSSLVFAHVRLIVSDLRRNGSLFFSRLCIRPVLIFLATRRRTTRMNVLFCRSRSKVCNINGRIIARWSAGMSLKSMFITGADTNLYECYRLLFSRLFQHISASVSFFSVFMLNGDIKTYSNVIINYPPGPQHSELSNWGHLLKKQGWKFCSWWIANVNSL